MRTFFRFEKLGMVGGVFAVSAIVTLYITFYNFVDFGTLSTFTQWFVLFAPLAVFLGIFVACGILEHFDKKKAGWKRKDRGSLPKEFTRGQFKGEF